MEEQYDELTIKLRDPDNQLIRMLDYIMHTANVGHSFNIMVDPDDSEHRKEFFIDGDGSFFMKELKKNSAKVKIKDGKILENYLKSLETKK